jgi:hypothetical protein
MPTFRNNSRFQFKESHWPQFFLFAPQHKPILQDTILLYNLSMLKIRTFIIILVCIQKGLRIPRGLHESGESKGAGFNM